MSVMLAALLPDFAVNAGVYNCLDVRLGTAGRITNPDCAGWGFWRSHGGRPRCLRAAHRALTSAMVMSDSQWIRSRAYALGGVTVGVIVLTGHLNDGGRGYAFMLDQQATGHGALPLSDGVGFAGIDYSIAGREPDVESSESTGPILYLWRREVPDSGGAGAHRGGNSLETMFVPWGATYAEISHACAGGAIPTMGVAGGFPGGTTYTEIHRDILVQGFRRLPDPSDPDAPTNVIASKVGRIELAARDGVRQVIAAGAGLG